MSKLPKAPLQEVIFDLKWNITNQADLVKYQYLHGDLYAILKDTYPERESLIPPEMPVEFNIHKAVHRVKSKTKYPLYQVGPGVITLNTDNENYFWEDYFKKIETLLDSFFSVYQKESNFKVTPSLTYIDFLKIDFKETSIIDFINNNLNLKIEQGFIKEEYKPNKFHMDMNFHTSIGLLTTSFFSGKNGKSEEGLFLRTKINSLPHDTNTIHILSWLEKAHEECSNIFKDLTKGTLYNSFN